MAPTREQAAMLYNLTAKMVRFSPTLPKFAIPRDSVKELACPELGTCYRALSSEATNAFGLSPVFAVHDELGQVRGPTSILYDALENSYRRSGEPAGDHHLDPGADRYRPPVCPDRRRPGG